MKICPECHKISTDDDFCSRCGAAVFSEDDYTASENIKCEDYKGHSHEKTSYEEKTSYDVYKNAYNKAHGSGGDDKAKENIILIIVVGLFIFLCILGGIVSTLVNNLLF